jgi:hypothetical protein
MATRRKKVHVRQFRRRDGTTVRFHVRNAATSNRERYSTDSEKKYRTRVERALRLFGYKAEEAKVAVDHHDRWFQDAFFSRTSAVALARKIARNQGR